MLVSGASVIAPAITNSSHERNKGTALAIKQGCLASEFLIDSAARLELYHHPQYAEETARHCMKHPGVNSWKSTNVLLPVVIGALLVWIQLCRLIRNFKFSFGPADPVCFC